MASSEEAEQNKQSVIPHIIFVLSNLLKRSAEENDVKPQHQSPASAGFSSWPEKPSNSISTFLFHIFMNTDCNPCHYVMAFIYIDRFLLRNPSVRIDFFNTHRLILAATLVAFKFAEQRTGKGSDAAFARVGRISVRKMNQLEEAFLFGLGYDLKVSPRDYASYCAFLQKQMNLLNPKAAHLLLNFFLSEHEDAYSNLIKAVSIV